jgi:hypothetical protein
MKTVLAPTIAMLILLTPHHSVAETGNQEKPRVIVTTDGEIDDKTSFVRFLMYSNEFETEGLIYGNSKWQRHGHGTVWMQA